VCFAAARNNNKLTREVKPISLPKRRQIRLEDYDYSSCGAYFITVCTQDRAHLFGEIVGATLCARPNAPDKIVEKWLSELEKKYGGVCVDKFIVMPDHVHFILRQAGDHIGSPLREIVGWFKTMTTNEYIRGAKSGLFSPFNRRLWQRGYYEHVIRNREDYADVWQYIDGNPQKWADDHG